MLNRVPFVFRRHFPTPFTIFYHPCSFLQKKDIPFPISLVCGNLFVELCNMIDQMLPDFVSVFILWNQNFAGRCSWGGWRVDTSWASSGKTTCWCINWEGIHTLRFALIFLLIGKVYFGGWIKWIGLIQY